MRPTDTTPTDDAPDEAGFLALRLVFGLSCASLLGIAAFLFHSLS